MEIIIEINHGGRSQKKEEGGFKRAKQLFKIFEQDSNQLTQIKFSKLKSAALLELKLKAKQKKREAYKACKHNLRFFNGQIFGKSVLFRRD